ncbi:hypothetical protein SBP28_003612 [Candidozyma auris]
MVSIVSDPAQGNVRGQQRRSRHHQQRGKANLLLSYPSPLPCPEQQVKEPREPDRRVAQRRQLHPVHNGQGASRHRAHADSDKSVNGSALSSTTAVEKVWAWVANPILENIGKTAIDRQGNPEPQKRTSGNNSVF